MTSKNINDYLSIASSIISILGTIFGIILCTIQNYRSKVLKNKELVLNNTIAIKIFNIFYINNYSSHQDKAQKNKELVLDNNIANKIFNIFCILWIIVLLLVLISYWLFFNDPIIAKTILKYKEFPPCTFIISKIHYITMILSSVIFLLYIKNYSKMENK